MTTNARDYTDAEQGTYAPVKVHVASVEAGVQLGQAPAPGSGYRAHYETFVLSANNPVACILPEDPDRVDAYVIALDNDIVIGPKTVVQSAQNTQPVPVPMPQGTYLPKTLTAPFRVCDCQAVHAGATTTASNSRVSVAAYYRK